MPVGHVTNGVHVPTWDSAEAEHSGRKPAARIVGAAHLNMSRSKYRALKDEELWDLRTAGRRALVAFARKRVALQRAHHGATGPEIDEAGPFSSETGSPWDSRGGLRRISATTCCCTIPNDWSEF